MNRAIVLDPFCHKQFLPTGSPCIPYDMALFTERVSQMYSPEKLVEGYAPFCKHLFIENFTDAKVGSLEITEENHRMLKSGYEARTDKELPVLMRWFSAESIGEVPKARVLDVILYSYQQIQEENKARGEEDSHGFVYEWGIIAVKTQDVMFELPMQPITMMRNALGKEEGGSGVSLDREKYLKSVEYWSRYALVK